MLKQAIANADATNQVQLRKLRGSLINITTENAILKAENSGFKQALFNEKKRRKRGKKVFKEFRAQENAGRAMFFSPTKIQAARQFKDNKVKEKANQKVEKDFKAKEKKLQASTTRLAIEQRKIDRLNQAKERKRAVEQKAAQKEQAKQAKEAAQQLELTLQALVKKSKRRSIVAIG